MEYVAISILCVVIVSILAYTKHLSIKYNRLCENAAEAAKNAVDKDHQVKFYRNECAELEAELASANELIADLKNRLSRKPKNKK